jgi:flagellar biosynthesis/type III secretory pathway protein FliH
MPSRRPPPRTQHPHHSERAIRQRPEPEERVQYERELKRRRDEIYLEGARRYARAEAFKEGKAEGWAEGFKEGKAQGRIDALICLIHSLEKGLNRTLTPEEALRSHSEVELRVRRDECFREVLANLASNDSTQSHSAD